ncbi:MAG: ATP synthase F1 subunit delta [Muribaculaceae bacterium]|mgnify:CR=1 FL=1|nr:ATP synthase F1 subunit delta [Muribaculaceae bacterium]
MNQGLIPRRYAKALYKFALEKGTDSRVYVLAGNLVDGFLSAPALNRAMANPFVPTADKIDLLTTAAKADKKTDTVFEDFLHLLADNNRLAFARDIAVAYRDIYRKANHIRRVTVVSAQQLDPAQETRLKKLIQTHLGDDKMEYNSSINPELIGGFTVSIDNERLDASLSNELNLLRQNLIKD